MDPFFFLGRRLILRELWQYLGTSRAICAIDDIHQHRPWEAAQQISPALFPVSSLAFPLAALDRYRTHISLGVNHLILPDNSVLQLVMSPKNITSTPSFARDKLPRTIGVHSRPRSCTILLLSHSG